MKSIFDAHLHLDHYPQQDLDRLLRRWHAHGVQHIMCVATHFQSCRTLLKWKQKYSDLIHIAFGYHPEQPLPAKGEIERIERLIWGKRVHLAAVGEVGLPHYRLSRMPARYFHAYEEMLARFARLACELDLPLIVHAVHEKAKSALAILQSIGVKKAHFHWLKAPEEVVREIVKANFYISVTPEVCYRKRDRHLASIIPLDRLLIETDGPWPYGGEFRDQDTTPLMLGRVIEEVASIKNIHPNKVRDRVAHNYRLLFG